MKKTLLIIIVSILSTGFLHPQEKEWNFTTKLIEKGVFDPDQLSYPEMDTQLANKYKPRVAFLGMFVRDDGRIVSNAINFIA